MVCKIIGANHQPIIEENTGAANEESTTNIQQFVLLLKRKLEKDMLKKLISEIKAYKVLGTIDSLIDLLKECHSKDIISKDDIDKFRPFVRKDDEITFNEIFEFNNSVT